MSPLASTSPFPSLLFVPSLFSRLDSPSSLHGLPQKWRGRGKGDGRPVAHIVNIHFYVTVKVDDFGPSFRQISPLYVQYFPFSSIYYRLLLTPVTFYFIIYRFIIISDIGPNRKVLQFKVNDFGSNSRQISSCYV